ncbi:MAG: hypothetical protein FWG17_04195 [Desulfovibrionaceae bacterium]|nr:hypothetical protein [Desulfovibrionaceae bacterium]
MPKKNNHAVSFVLSLLAALVSACAGFQDESERRVLPLPAKTGRTDPGYVQYLERQSMLGHASRLSKIVSGSNLNWQNAATQPLPDELLNKGNVWLHIHPQNLLSSAQDPPLRQLGQEKVWDILRDTGINGLYLAPTGSGGNLWDHERRFEPNGNDDIIQYTFPKNIGSEQDYAGILQQAEARKMLLGGDLLPLAGGIGPDFFLSAQNVRDYPGLYCMFDVPEEFWALLPSSRNNNGADWHVTPMKEEEVRRLAEKKLIPEKMLQDDLPYVSRSGWAVTDEVRGLDGNLRRWVYRYAYSYKRPLLNIYDPSQTALKVLNGSLIYQVGILGNALAGYQTAPLIGLDAADKHEPDITGASNYAASFRLAGDLARQSRSYGGWAWMQDELPLPFLREVMQSGPDLVKDSVLSPAVEHALLTGKTFLLGFMLDEAMKENIDFRRLVHTSSGPYGVDYTLPHLRYMSRLSELEEEDWSGEFQASKVFFGTPGLSADRGLDFLEARGDWHRQVENEKNLDNSLAEIILYETLGQVRRKAQPPAGGGRMQAAFENSTLYTTPAGLASLALGLAPERTPNAEEQQEIRRGHMLMQFFKAMQPGIFMLGGQDLLGTMPLPFYRLLPSDPLKNWDKRLVPMGAYALSSGSEGGVLNGQSLPKAVSLYGPLDVQTLNSSSALKELGEILHLRRTLGVDKGVFTGRLPVSGAGMIATVTRLTQGSAFTMNGGAYIIAICNYSRESGKESLDLSRFPDFAAMPGEPAISLLYGDIGNIKREGNTLSLNAPGWSKALILVESSPNGKNRVKAPQAELAELRPVPLP